MKNDVLSKPAGDADEFWDAETKAIFKKLEPHYQRFLLAFIRDGRAARAYLECGINPDATPETAANGGWRMLRNPNIQAILEKLSDRRGEALYRVNRTYLEMTEAVSVGKVPKSEESEGDEKFEYAEVPDWSARNMGAQGLARLYGLNAPEKVEDDRVAALMELISKK
jgi:hypothetical protein